jgi:tetratricopeptide (TPR) repeat protein
LISVLRTAANFDACANATYSPVPDFVGVAFSNDDLSFNLKAIVQQRDIAGQFFSETAYRRSRSMGKRRRQSSAKHGAANSATLMIDAPSAQLRAARGLWNQGQRADALRLFEDAVQREPNNVRTYIMAARAYAEKYDFLNMEGIFEKLVRRAPRHPGVHHYIGETYRLLKLPDRAIASYEQASRLPGAGPPTWMELALLYERAHRLDDAEELIERAMLTDGNAPLAWLVRGRIQRRKGRPDEAEATFRDLIKRTPPDSELACQVWGELALMKDQQGEWNGAIEAIERCKQIHRAAESLIGFCQRRPMNACAR